jgi:hypothetical protein
MPLLSSSRAYIHFVIIEYPTVVLKPSLRHHPSAFIKASPSSPTSSTYQRRDRRRHSTSHLLRIFRRSSRPTQRHPHSTFRWQRTFSVSLCPPPLSLYFLLLPTLRFLPSGPPLPCSSRSVPFAVGTGASTSAPFQPQSSPASSFTFFT